MAEMFLVARTFVPPVSYSNAFRHSAHAGGRPQRQIVCFVWRNLACHGIPFAFLWVPCSKQTAPAPINPVAKNMQISDFLLPTILQAVVPPISLPRIHKWRAGSEVGTRAPHLTSNCGLEPRQNYDSQKNLKALRPSLAQVSLIGTQTEQGRL